MANYKLKESLFKSLTALDKAILTEIYYKRCLDIGMVYDFFDHSELELKDIEFIFEKLEHEFLIEKVLYHKTKSSYFLTTLGIEAIKAIFPENNNIKNSNTLKIHHQNINHQLALNRFSFKLKKYAEFNEYSFEYYDQKFMPPCNIHMMADGLAIINNELYLLEMDMKTERYGNLMEKWDNYRMFLGKKGEFYQNKKITMLFILENVSKKIGQRKDTVAKSIHDGLLFYTINDFEVYADSPQKLLEMLQAKVYKPKKEFSIFLNDEIKMFVAPGKIKGLDDISFDYYGRFLTKDKKIVKIKGTPQEFLIDLWCDNRYSVLHKIVYQDRLRSLSKHIVGREIPYIVVTNNLKELQRLLEKIELNGPINTLFTTKERLQKKPLNEALLKLDSLGNSFHFSDMSFKDMIFEKKIVKRMK